MYGYLVKTSERETSNGIVEDIPARRYSQSSPMT